VTGPHKRGNPGAKTPDLSLLPVELITVEAVSLEPCERIDMITELAQESADLSFDAVGVSLCPTFAGAGPHLVAAGLFIPGRGRHVVSFVVGRGQSLVGVHAEVDLRAVGEQKRQGAAKQHAATEHEPARSHT
jgi:hypothetical protein